MPRLKYVYIKLNAVFEIENNKSKSYFINHVLLQIKVTKTEQINVF